MDDSLLKHAIRICPNPDCEYDKHEEGANFCILCGTLLYRRCDDCLKENPRYARFCYYCGTDLDELREQQAADQARFFREDISEEPEDADETENEDATAMLDSLPEEDDENES